VVFLLKKRGAGTAVNPNIRHKPTDEDKGCAAAAGAALAHTQLAQQVIWKHLLQLNRKPAFEHCYAEALLLWSQDGCVHAVAVSSTCQPLLHCCQHCCCDFRTAVRDLASVQSLSSALMGYDSVTFLRQCDITSDNFCYTAAVQDCCA
jgi:hypothetical protein